MYTLYTIRVYTAYTGPVLQVYIVLHTLLVYTVYTINCIQVYNVHCNDKPTIVGILIYACNPN